MCWSNVAVEMVVRLAGLLGVQETAVTLLAGSGAAWSRLIDVSCGGARGWQRGLPAGTRGTHPRDGEYVDFSGH